MTRFRNRRPDFLAGSDGSMTVLAMIMVFMILAVGGIAADYANAIRVRTALQVSADAAAHAALLEREFESVDTARAKGVTIAQGTLVGSAFNNAVYPTDINFGFWDAASDTFTVDNNSRRAVLIDTARIAARGNSVATYFLSLVGFDEWNVTRQTVFEVYDPACLVEGYVSDTRVEIGLHSLFEYPFCIRSNGTISIEAFNTFEPGVWIHAPTLASVTGDSTNIGLTEAVRPKEPTNLRILERIADIIAGVADPSSTYFRSYINSSFEITITPSLGITPATWQEGRIHRATCTNPKHKLAIGGFTMRRGVLVTNCIVVFTDTVLEDVVIANTSVDVRSFNGSDGIQLGRADNCAPGGSAQLVTMGGIDFAAKLQLHNGQMIAAGDIKFVSHANGHWGGSVIAGGKIDSGNLVTQRACNGVGSEDNFSAAYFRLAY